MFGNKIKIATTVSVATKAQFNKIVRTTKRSEEELAREALENYAELKSWQLEETKKGLEEAKRGEFASDEEVTNVFKKWRTI